MFRDYNTSNNCSFKFNLFWPKKLPYFACTNTSRTIEIVQIATKLY